MEDSEKLRDRAEEISYALYILGAAAGVISCITVSATYGHYTYEYANLFCIHSGILFQNFLLKYAGEYLSQRIRYLQFSAMMRQVTSTTWFTPCIWNSHRDRPKWCTWILQEIGWFDKRSNQVGSLTSRLANDASRIKIVWEIPLIYTFTNVVPLHWVDCFLSLQATGAPLASLTNAFSAVVLSVLVAILSGWQFGLVMVGLMPLQTLAGFIQSYGTNKFALKAAGSVEESGKVWPQTPDFIWWHMIPVITLGCSVCRLPLKQWTRSELLHLCQKRISSWTNTWLCSTGLRSELREYDHLVNPLLNLIGYVDVLVGMEREGPWLLDSHGEASSWSVEWSTR